MQPAISETKIKFLDPSISVHHYTLRAPCPKGQGNRGQNAVQSGRRYVYANQRHASLRTGLIVPTQVKDHSAGAGSPSLACGAAGLSTAVVCTVGPVTSRRLPFARFPFLSRIP